jgi:lactoylglutathione lyase
MADVSLTLLVLKTRQVEQLRAFYETLGVDLVEEQHGKGPVHFVGRAGAVVIEVYPLPDEGSLVDSSTRLGFARVDSSTRLGFAVENVAEVIRVLEETGTKIVTPPKETAWGFQAVVKDPDGRSVELTQPRRLLQEAED